MKYYKNEADGYILSITTNTGDTEITEEEYNDILAAAAQCPLDESFGYRLKSDLTWEQYELPQEQEIDDTEALEIILGGAD